MQKINNKLPDNTTMFETIIKKINNAEKLSVKDLEHLLSLEDERAQKLLFEKAYLKKKQSTGNKVFLRGLIELSNICTEDCYYCGIRKSNKKYRRYFLSRKEVVDCINFAYRNNYASVVIQAGERKDKKFVDYVTDILHETRKLTKGNLRITLSLGEQTEETYRKWYEAGARRYLLRIETSNPKLYAEIHPESSSFEDRKNCLKILKKTGYQLGTGVLIGFPGQTVADLAKDIKFYKDIDVDMIGMGPYIPHRDTPMGKDLYSTFDDKARKKSLLMGLKMIAATKIYLPDINIAATTALEALSPKGLEQGVLAGANVIMININDHKYKKSYILYDNKPCFESDILSFQSDLNKRIKKIGSELAFGVFGDAVHYTKKQRQYGVK
ncbi:MAG: [FeFe] hydrogenase H-cluster radical SAM maturase HydE [Victivallales bacterium]|nr:[FeFe] hydrogenase H-cluster radical SAM maturase HydE [Victivallales bacterium]MCF7888844.1 [FeFe] hydrogenase H-cluster radical SAM maturase HydE [Victivallales bacterium]